jgi:hypothetical protein
MAMLPHRALREEKEARRERVSEVVNLADALAAGRHRGAFNGADTARVGTETNLLVLYAWPRSLPEDF